MKVQDNSCGSNSSSTFIKPPPFDDPEAKNTVCCLTWECPGFFCMPTYIKIAPHFDVTVRTAQTLNNISSFTYVTSAKIVPV